MDRFYLPAANQADAVARTAALACTPYGPVSPWVTAALAQAGVVTPCVLLANGQQAYAVISDNPNTTKAIVDAAAVPFAAIETATATAAANRQTVLARAQSALAANATYLAIGSPTTAQAVAQVGALTQQMDAVIRLLTQQFDATT